MSAAGFVSITPLHHPSTEDLQVADMYATLGDSTIGLTELHSPHHFSFAQPQTSPFLPQSSCNYPSTPGSTPPDSPSIHPVHLSSQFPTMTSPREPEPTPSPASPAIPEYRPLPPMTPRTILTRLSEITASQPKKKSHARKQPPGHIPRPRNAFILFRCFFVNEEAVPASVEKDHRNISRIAGRVWKAMSDTDKEPWVRAAEMEKVQHEKKWPGYRYNPVQVSQPLPRRNGAFGNVAGGSRTQGVGPSRMPEERGRSLVRDHGYDREDHDYGVPMGLHMTIPLAAPQPVPSNAPLMLHQPFPRIASVPPSSSMEDGMMHPHLQFNESFHYHSSANTPTPISAHHTGQNGTPTSTYSYESSLPPDSPISFYQNTTGHSFGSGRAPVRRSSSCPPLPPQGMFFSQPDEWVGPTPSAYTSTAPVPVLAMDTQEDTVEQHHQMFSNPFAASSNSESAPIQFTSPFGNATTNGDAQTTSPTTIEHQQESLDNPGSLLSAPRYSQIHMSFGPIPSHHTPSRLARRRGSSLDRALASSSIAGAIGPGFGGHAHAHGNGGIGGYSMPVMSRASQTWARGSVSEGASDHAVLWAQQYYHGQQQSQHQAQQGQGHGQQQEYRFGGHDQQTHTHAHSHTSYSPVQSFSNHATFAAHAQPYSHHHTPSQSSSSAGTPALSPSPQSTFEDAHDSHYSNHNQTQWRSSSSTYPVKLESPPSETPIRKVSARLFGSQGARLGLDLDLDSPPLSGSGDAMESPGYPYTPASSGAGAREFVYRDAVAVGSDEEEYEHHAHGRGRGRMGKE